tara:strand:- start:196 stop:399 length:204 start_codon:yes stop_codon:yes gene_type:complete
MHRTLRLSKRFKEILQLETERNDILLDSNLRGFAFSEDKIFEQSIDIFMAELNNAVIDDFNEAIVHG